MRGETVVQWYAEDEARVLARIQTEPFPPRIHVLTPEHGWRNDRQLRHHRLQWKTGIGREVGESEAQRIAASWGWELLFTWDDAVPALDETGPA